MAFKRSCEWCGEDANPHIYAIRKISVFFSGAHGGRSSESVTTLYFCDHQHRINYFREP